MNKRLLLPLLLGALLTSSFWVLGCDSSNPVAPTGSVLTLTANPTLISLNGRSTITATGFRPDGNTLNPGTRLNVSTSLGVLENAAGAPVSIIEIDDFGRATVFLESDGRQGEATVTATLPGSETEAMTTVQIGDTDETRPTISLTATPSVIDLGEEAEVAILVRNADGSTFTSGGDVLLRTSLGGLKTDGSSPADPGEESLSVAVDSAGEATAILKAGDQPGTATITGTIDSSEEATVDVTIENQVPSLVITVAPEVLTLQEDAQISLLARDDQGQAIAIDVTLQTSLGWFSGCQAGVTSGPVSTDVTTSSTGEATVEFCSGTEPGTATITAVIGTADPITATATIQNQQPTLTLTAQPNRINIEEGSTISIVARDDQGLPLAGGRVTLRTTLGVLSDENPTTGSNGEATVTLTANDDGQTGTADITSFVDTSATVMSTVTIIGTRVLVTVSPSTLDTTETATVTLQVQDEDSVPLTDAGRYFVQLTASLGTFEDDVVEVVNGVGTTTYIAGVTAGVDTIEATLANAQADMATVELRSIPTSLVLSVNTNTVSPTGGAVTLTATVSDADGLVLPSEIVTFTVADGVGGVFSPSRAVTTDINGEATSTVTFASNDLPAAGTSFTITATTRGPEGQPPVSDVVTIRVE